MRNRTKLSIFKRFVTDLTSLSKCEERGVAAIITDSDFNQVHSIGINGGARQLNDCLCVLEGKYGCVHAEINCLNKNTYHGKDKIMIVSLAPCSSCAASIINTPGGFEAVYYIEGWKEDTGIKMLKAAGIRVEQI